MYANYERIRFVMTLFAKAFCEVEKNWDLWKPFTKMSQVKVSTLKLTYV